MTPPFPVLHTRANEDATLRTEAARSLTDLAEAFLQELDALLGTPGPPTSPDPAG